MSTIAGLIKKGDVQIFYFVNGMRHRFWLDSFMKKITCLGDTFFVVTVPFLMIFLGQENVKKIGIHMAIHLILSEAMVHGIKRVVNRPRPVYTLEDVNLVTAPPCQYSFPSGHTCGAFAVALSLAALPLFIRSFALVIASLVGVSRVYLGVHYPTDVVVGFFIAFMTTGLLGMVL